MIDSTIPVSVLILTKNEEHDLPGCLQSVSWCDDVHVYDSGSTDQTLAIAEQHGARVTQRTYPNSIAPFGETSRLTKTGAFDTLASNTLR